MLTPSSPRRRRAAHPQARLLRQEYHEFILQRIEEYKDALGREEILSIGDEAVRELDEAARSQYVLTEVLMLEHVDRIIAQRLRLPSFKRWKGQHGRLRDAQRTPTHWGLDANSLLVDYALRLEPGEQVVVVGTRWLSAALFLAAHDARVLVVDQDLAAVESAEHRAVTEQLAGRVDALVVRFGGWFPEVDPALAVLDPGALGDVSASDRGTLLDDLKRRTRPGGVHLVVPPVQTPAVIPLGPDTLQRRYSGWQVVRRPKAPRGAGFAAIKPARHSDTVATVSE